MRFKMAPNSLFAILLRSPWWISIAIAVVFMVVASALLPEELRLFGAAGGLPFLVLGAVAFWRQWGQPSATQVEALQQRLATLSWGEFSPLLQQGFQRQGYVVEPAQGGADLRLRRDGRQTLVSAKRWKAARHGEEAIQALAQAVRRDDDVSAGAYIALGDLSPQALRLADREGIQVLNAAALAQLLRGVSLPSA
jgi:restriction system protein